MSQLPGMIIGCLLTILGVYLYDSMSTSSVANGDTRARTIVNWDVAAADWDALKTRAQESWNKLASK